MYIQQCNSFSLTTTTTLRNILCCFLVMPYIYIYTHSTAAANLLSPFRVFMSSAVFSHCCCCCCCCFRLLLPLIVFSSPLRPAKLLRRLYRRKERKKGRDRARRIMGREGFIAETCEPESER